MAWPKRSPLGGKWRTLKVLATMSEQHASWPLSPSCYGVWWWPLREHGNRMAREFVLVPRGASAVNGLNYSEGPYHGCVYTWQLETEIHLLSNLIKQTNCIALVYIYYMNILSFMLKWLYIFIFWRWFFDLLYFKHSKQVSLLLFFK